MGTRYVLRPSAIYFRPRACVKPLLSEIVPLHSLAHISSEQQQLPSLRSGDNLFLISLLFEHWFHAKTAE